MKKLWIPLLLMIALLPVVSAQIPYDTTSWSEKFGNVVSGIETKMEFPLIVIGIWEIAFIMKSTVTDKNIKNVFINVTKGTLPSGYKPFPGKQNMVWVINWSVQSPAEFESVKFKYRVPYDWITQNGLTPQNVSLYRYTSPTEMEELPTTYKGNYSTVAKGMFANMESTAKGLSVFVVGEAGQTLEEPEPIVTNVTNETANVTPPCVEDWTCGNWSACVNGTRTRTCTDNNNCNTTTQKPPTTQACEVVPAEEPANVTNVTQPEAKPVEEKKPFYATLLEGKTTRLAVYIVGGVLALAVIILIVSFIWRKVSSWHEHRVLSEEFDRRVEKMWERKMEEEAQKESEGRNLPGMPPRKE